ncbi:Integral membrane protein [Venustampulla echinocandica]|uniref:Integral membrane protein n=1 Tax=Venustampulla echinocandica TaxID=2656787 RepID=A0A370TQ34_9HELO|nr:Integral membrane protein [Venustampulla echinocandica]RDL37633.1 Integral membrane protein [Venustampulla echinocandica]
MLAADLLLFLLRVGELAFTTVVVGLTGHYLHQTHQASTWSRKRFIYTEVISALGLLFSLLFLFPFARSFIHYPVDFLLFIGLMVAFGLLASFIGPMNCGSIWNWGGITGKSTCSQFKANIAFCFLASIFFLASGFLGMYYVHRRRAVTDGTVRRRRWYRSRV